MTSELQMPSVPELMLSILRAVQALGGSVPAWKIDSAVVKAIDPKGELMKAQTTDKGRPALLERTSRARAYCMSVKLIKSPRKNLFEITADGARLIGMPAEEARAVVEGLEREMLARKQMRRGKGAKESASPTDRPVSAAKAGAGAAASGGATVAGALRMPVARGGGAAAGAAASGESDGEEPSAAAVSGAAGLTTGPADTNAGHADGEDALSVLDGTADETAGTASRGGVPAYAWEDDEEWEQAWKQSLLERLSDLPQSGLKRYVLDVLRAFGFELRHPGGRGEEGIDGVGAAPISRLLSAKIVVQVRRGDTGEPVGRGEVALFQRDAYAQGAERAVMVALGGYTESAVRTARDARPTVELINGDRLCDMIREKRVGVRLTPHAVPDFFDRFAE